MAEPSRPDFVLGPVLLENLDGAVDRLVHRLDGLSDDEYLWEPVHGMWSVRDSADGPQIEGAGVREIEPAPVTTIAWRLWHLAMDCFLEYTQRFAADMSGASADWTTSADEAISRLQANWAGYRQVAVSRGWAEPLGPDWGPFAEATTADIVLHASNEFIHHAAEIALLRDLYRSQGG